MDDTQNKMAKAGLRSALVSLGIEQAQVSKLITRRTKPSIERAALIEQRIGIPAASWADGSFLEAYWSMVTRGG